MLHVFILGDYLMPLMLDILCAYLLIAVLTMQVLLLIFMGRALLKIFNVVSLIFGVTDFNDRHLLGLKFLHVLQLLF